MNVYILRSQTISKTTKSQSQQVLEFQDNDRSICLNCQSNINTKGGNTSGMNRHLKRSHPAIWKTLMNDVDDDDDGGDEGPKGFLIIFIDLS
jgi:hypothetical protein